MAEKTTSNYNFDSSDLLLLIFKNFKPLFIICVIAFIVSAIISLTITPKYKSTVILFPTASSSVSKALLTNNVDSEGILIFGEEEDAEKLLQVLNSDEIRYKIIEKYDLMNHYGIDSTSKYPLTNIYNEYKDNISFKRTEFMSVEIEVLDEDPQFAAEIANDIASLLDSTMNRMRRERARKALKIVEREYLTLKNQIETLEDSLKTIRKKGVHDYESQSEVFNAAYAIALAEGNVKGVEILEKKLEVLAENGGMYVFIKNFLEFETEQLSDLKAKYAEAKVEAEQNLPNKYIVDHAFKAEKKSYPIRWLIVMISTISTFFLALFMLIILNHYKKVIKL